VIIEQIKKVIRTFSPAQAQHEALVGLDFKTSDEKSALMQMCFSVFSNWPLAVIFILFLINPLRYQFSIHRFFEADGRLMLWAYSENFFLGFIIFLLLQTLIRSELLWLSVIGWFISNGDIHVFISVGCVVGVFFASARRNLKLIPLLEAKMKKTWTYFSMLQLLGLLLAAVINYFLYFNLKNFGFFSATMNVNRFEFFILVVLLHHGIQLGVFSIWGHFYSRRKIEPADWKVSYSTADLFSKLSLGSVFKAELKTLITEKLTEKSNLSGSEGVPERLLKLSKVEAEYLTSAQTYLK
jgi:hypothetical protein